MSCATSGATHDVLYSLFLKFLQSCLNSTRANTKCTRHLLMKYNYEKSEIKYLNIGSEAEVTALDKRLYSREV